MQDRKENKSTLSGEVLANQSQVFNAKIDEEQAKIIELCKEFDQYAFAAEPIKLLIELMNSFLNSEDDEELPAVDVRSIVYQVSRIVTFIAFLHEGVQGVEFFKRQMESNTLIK